ncbi:MAG: DUF3810 domain-containing protein [Saprospiraceae bacterium]|nr:DUF3810 domain-containing protein [Saprospiraceae bacterium]
MTSIKSLVFKLKWLSVAILIFLIGLLFQSFPGLTDTIYRNGIFQLFRIIYDYTLGWIPLPMVYFLFLLVVYIIYQFLGKAWSMLKSKYFGKLSILTMNGLSIIYILFYVLWGFNYYTPTVKQKLAFTSHKMDREDLYEEARYVARSVSSLRMKAIGDSSININETTIPEDLENQLRNEQKIILKSWGYLTNGRVRIRRLEPDGVLLRISTAGVYIPWVLEGHIDDGLHPIQWPFTMAHEMAHGYGITDEGECNFVGFVTCISSDNLIIRYSAELAYFRYLINNLRLVDNDRYKEVVRSLTQGVKNDINAIILQMRKYPDILPDFRDLVYDSYLKSHGVHEGLASYSSIIRLINQWKKSGRDRELITRTFPWSVHE